MRRAVAAALAVGGLAGGAAVAQMAPAAVAWRQARVRWLPGLSGVGHPGHIGLTFDDGPDPASTPAFLDELDSLGWKATFFVLGRNAAANAELTAEVARRGHELAVHGFSHANLLWRGPRWAQGSFQATADLVAEITGARPLWARPPYGALSSSSLAGARLAGLRPVLWTTWGRDWRERATAETIVADVMATHVPGATVLLHDSDCTSSPGSWKGTLAALPLLAERWAASGLAVGPLSEHGLR